MPASAGITNMVGRRTYSTMGTSPFSILSRHQNHREHILPRTARFVSSAVNEESILPPLRRPFAPQHRIRVDRISAMLCRTRFPSSLQLLLVSKLPRREIRTFAREHRRNL